MFIVLTGMTCSGEWKMFYVGQADTAGLENVEAVLAAVKKVLDDVDPSLWDRVMVVGTDGCHGMRSTAAYAGPDGNTNAHADNFFSKFKRLFDSQSSRERRGDTKQCHSYHCLLHLGNLAMGDVVEDEVRANLREHRM